MKRVYVAGAFSCDNVIGVLDNMRRGMRWSTKVLLAGHAPFCPWMDFHYQLMLREGESLTVENYYEYSLAWLRASDVVFVTPASEKSLGTLAEIKEAERLGIPIVFSIYDIDKGDAGSRPASGAPRGNGRGGFRGTAT